MRHHGRDTDSFKFDAARRWAFALVAAISAGAVGCTSADPGGGVGTQRQFVISDELHNNGTRGFVFLPPVVPRPAYFGEFLPDVDPVVRIDEIDATGATIRTLATFTRTSGPDRERLRTHFQGRPCDDDDDDGDDDPEGYFYARWKTNHERLSLAAIYRIRVLVRARAGGLRELGFGDVDVVRNQREFRGVDRSEFIPLIDGRTLRIKFRIDRSAVDADRDGVYDWRDNCPDAANPDQRDSLRNGVGDACRCAGVTCTAANACHAVGACSPATGVCGSPALPDGAACSLPGADAACAGGECVVSSCLPERGDCDGSAANGCETSLATVAHCGGCGTVCAPAPHGAPACTAGACALACDVGWADCDGDRANGCEQDVATDGAHCGACGRACTLGRTCLGGACSTATCAAPLADCDGADGNGCEVSLAGDERHCGACGNACSFAHAAAACVGATCTLTACHDGRGNCDSDPANGCEVSFGDDVSHCGGCGRACALAHASPTCVAGACAVRACELGWADCNAAAFDGCEANLRADSQHCGSCGSACSIAHGAPACVDGACRVGACDAGWADCDGDASNGCEADLADPAHCGGCGTRCPSGANGAATCSAGVCGLRCDDGFASCDGDASDGCEVDARTDGAHCGACGVACTEGRTCQAGSCSVAVCAAGQGNCDGQELNGCEATLASDVAHCGACGNACGFTHAFPECAAGACTFSVCEIGHGDCDAVRANGCEVALASDVAHCGACGHACAPGQRCQGGACITPCSPAETLCVGSCVDTRAHASHCGACGHACAGAPNAVGVCAAGACAIACATGYNNCDGDLANGCETLGLCAAYRVATVGGARANDLAYDGTWLYTVNVLGPSYRVPADAVGASVPTPFQNAAAYFTTRVFGAHLYWDTSWGAIQRARLDGVGGVETVRTGLADVGAFLLEGDDLFWMNYVPGDGLLRRTSVSSGETAVLGTTQGPWPTGLVRDTRDGSFIMSSQQSQFLWRLPATGGARAVAYDLGAGRAGTQLAQDAVYFYTGTYLASGGQVLRIRKDTGVVEVVASAQGSPWGIHVTPTRIYWTIYFDHSIWAVPH